MKRFSSYFVNVVASVFTVFLMSVTANAAERPNILLIAVDDMGFSDVSPFGGEMRTPNIQQLADRGLRFTHFYTAPSCSPTRTMMLTGRDNHVAGMGTMGEDIQPEQRGKPGYEGHINNRSTTFVQLLRDSGYHTYMAGKWHLGTEAGVRPHDRGFEKSFSMLIGGTSHFSGRLPMFPGYIPIYSENGEVVEELPEDFYSSQYYTDRIINWISDKEDDAPFLAYLSFTAPHDPLHLPDDWIDRCRGMYDMGYDQLRETRFNRLKELGIVDPDITPHPRLPNVRPWESLSADEKAFQKRVMEVYAGMIENVDYQIGRVIEVLKEKNMYDNTLILFFSDNGANGSAMADYPWNAERDMSTFDNTIDNIGRRESGTAPGPGWAQASMTPFRLYKTNTAEGGIRSPLIIAGQGVESEGGRIRHDVVHVMDIAPTILDIAGVNSPATYAEIPQHPVQGKSMAPVLGGEEQLVRGSQDYLGWELFGMKAIRQGDYKGLWLPANDKTGTGSWQIYNITKDPGETTDLARSNPVLRKKMVKLWEQYAEENGVILLTQSLFKHTFRCEYDGNTMDFKFTPTTVTLSSGGSKETVDIQYREVSPNRYFVSFTESDGTRTTLFIDLHIGKIYNSSFGKSRRGPFQWFRRGSNRGKSEWLEGNIEIVAE